ncbi:MAG: peptide ABC transporter substrate-binding protein [Acetobacteraceae bacterium]
MEVVDDHTAILHLPQVTVSFAQWDQVIPEHLEGPVYAAAKAAGDYINHTIYNHAPTTPGLWNGPYLISDYKSGDQIVLSRNPHWTGPAPGFKQVVLRTIGDTAALQANLLSGDIDMDNNLTLDQVLSLRKQYPDRFTYLFTPSLTYGHIDVARDNPVLSDVRVRRALLMAIDRRTIDKRLFDDMQPLATSFVSPRNPDFDPSIPPVEYDLPGARKLLAEAGWTPGPDGICRNAAGQRLSAEFLAAAGFRLNELEMQVMQSAWKQIGVEVTLRTEPSRTLFGQTMKHRSFTGLAMYTWTSNVGESPRLTLGIDRIPSEANNWGGANFTGFSDPRFNAAITVSETELDPAKRHAAWVEMQHVYADELPALPTFISAVPAVLPKWLHGFSFSGTGSPSRRTRRHGAPSEAATVSRARSHPLGNCGRVTARSG